jgi:phenylalanyl-tRNA synthetase beta chain
MTISYRWLSDYLPFEVAPERLSHILTSIGLEVEGMEEYEEIKGGLNGLLIGEVLAVAQHPNADKLKVTTVSVGGEKTLQIVCGASNVAAGQKVVVAPVGATIYPIAGEPVTMKLAKIRGVESHGMICAEDEIGIGTSHEGILVLENETVPGLAANEYFQPYHDVRVEIGLTPNRMDAMSHMGVARDVCAYLTHHDKKEARAIIPDAGFKVDKETLQISAVIENKSACKRYSGVCISNVKVNESPKWLQARLKVIGLRPINNIVDITNYIQYETGQPLHAFDYDAIAGHKIVVKTETEGTSFTTLDGKERKLNKEDLVICDAEKGMCLAGVFGGAASGVTADTKNIFLESASFDPLLIRKTSFRHNLRTDAATRFEKGVDISNTIYALERAAMLIKELGNAAIASPVLDIYPEPEPKKQINFDLKFLHKLSGKTYQIENVKGILEALGFVILRDEEGQLLIDVPYHKNDVSIPADIVEEIIRIDGLDNIEIPSAIRMTPSVDINSKTESKKEKIAGYLVGLGFNEILTNSITNSKYFSKENLDNSVKLLNNLSNELDVLRPAILPTALEVISFNHNRKNGDLRLFEFGKTYKHTGSQNYSEKNHLCLYMTGRLTPDHWKEKSRNTDLFYLKGIAQSLFTLLGVEGVFQADASSEFLEDMMTATINKVRVLKLGKVAAKTASEFDIKQPVYFANFDWDVLLGAALQSTIQHREVSKYPAVTRDLAIVLQKNRKFGEVTEVLQNLQLENLNSIKLFDLFESEKLGANKKSLAVNFTFSNPEKTLTDKEIDGLMNKIMSTLEKEIGAEIRK